MTSKQRERKVSQAVAALQKAVALLAEVDDDIVASFEHFKPAGQEQRARIVRAHTLATSALDTIGA